uniref:SnoaL-like domain-containing protein n=1 Tax=Chromera velia CCMP2878 TaxID=1169474 RepID=A0A0G4H9K7_9ALVE|eukprot:Cvel_25436.t1-p1 / transcript=Cvel_25436.t1 / gene=Cvel_25436 / organism=Chromera_velia_CCMP2878 / gene_product=hypothetical protein / transcript_product=hypothetical protein / location=Cvel_scaffold2881:15575-16036(-) / protein_length=154 / sequence_SO=supercontig / SO=protein_coding / is_pseudo=false
MSSGETVESRMAKIKQLADDYWKQTAEYNFDGVASFYSEGATVTQHFGPQRGVKLPYQAFLKSMKGATLLLDALRFDNVRRHIHPDGFVEEHEGVFTIQGKEYVLPVCFVVAMDKDCKIVRAEEYGDGATQAHIVKAIGEKAAQAAAAARASKE